MQPISDLGMSRLLGGGGCRGDESKEGPMIRLQETLQETWCTGDDGKKEGRGKPSCEYGE